MANVAYIRVSTVDQNNGRQFEAIKELENKGIKFAKIFNEKVSGKNTDRPQLKAMLDYIREGDCVYVESYSRLARNTRDLLELVDTFNNNGVSFVSLKENIDTTTPQGRLMMTLFAGLAQFERECILQRQKEGIAIAKADGKYKGRKQNDLPTNWNKTIEEWKSGRITAKVAMNELHMSQATFWRRVKALENN